MSFTKTVPTQKPLPFGFNCSDCPLKRQGYCEGIDDLRTYSMEHPSLIGCYDLKRIEKYLSEVFAKLIPPPLTFFQDKINFSESPFGIADGRIDLSEYGDIPLFVVSMNDFIKDSGDLRFKDMSHLKKILKLPSNAKVALIGTSSEKIQQAIWRVSERLGIWKRIAEFGFEWATSPTFPVWDINPRSDQIILQFRNYLASDLMASYGLPVIPFVYPYNATDHQTFRNWIKDRPSINKVAILAQYYETDEQFAQLVKNINKIQDYAGKELQFLIVGVTQKSKLQQALLNFPNASIISWSPYYEAFLKGKLYDINLKSEQRLDLAKPVVAYRNYLTFSEVIKQLRSEANKFN